MSKVISTDLIKTKIFFIRGRKVMLDRDLAELFGVETKYLNRQVRRNRERFPEEFMIRLDDEEKKELVTNCHRFNAMKHSSSSPYAFTEHGVAMLASVLKSEIAVKISIHIIKVFIKMQEVITLQGELSIKLKDLEHRVGKHDQEMAAIIQAIHKILSKPEPELSKRRIGFHQE